MHHTLASLARRALVAAVMAGCLASPGHAAPLDTETSPTPPRR